MINKLLYRIGLESVKFRYYHWKFTQSYLWGWMNFIREPWFTNNAYTEIFYHAPTLRQK